MCRMGILVFVAVANTSLSDNFEKVRAAQELPAPDDVYSTWDQFKRDGSSTMAGPFSEFAPLFSPGILDPYTEVDIYLIGRDDDKARLLKHAAKRDNGDQFSYRDYVTAYCRQAFAGKQVICNPLKIGEYIVTNSASSPDKAAIQAVVLSLAARIEKERPRDAMVAVNEIAGATAAQIPLQEAADAYGWQRWDLAGRVSSRLGQTLDAPAIAYHWGVARSLVSGFDNDRLAAAISTKTFDAPAAVKNALSQADSCDALGFIMPQQTTPPSVVMNPFGLELFRRCAGSGRPFYSATQHLLQDQGYRRQANRLQGLLERWGKADLFGANQVSELVMHTDSHCEAVDRNVASITAPLLADGILAPKDVFHLAVAAWLHDWGHAGAAISPDFTLAAIRDPNDIRATHGLLSAERIRHLPRQTGLAPDETEVPAIIAAHHQGWTSIDNQAPGDTPNVLKAVGRTSPTLTRDINDATIHGLPNEDGRKLPLLTAIFRICDAADVGVHRAFYRDTLRDRLRDEILLYAISAIRPQAQGATLEPEWEGYFRALGDAVIDHLEAEADPTMFEVGGVVPTGRQTTAVVKAISDYTRHCLKQVSYFEHHDLVLGVHLAMEKTDGGGWTLQPYVTPKDMARSGDALLGVSQDILRELGDTLSSLSSVPTPNPEEMHKAAVKKLLQSAHIDVAVAKLA